MLSLLRRRFSFFALVRHAKREEVVVAVLTPNTGAGANACVVEMMMVAKQKCVSKVSLIDMV
jgi:hypothetical protein